MLLAPCRFTESKKQALEGGMSGHLTRHVGCAYCSIRLKLNEVCLFVVCTLFERKESDGENDDLARSRRHLSVHSLVSPPPLYLITALL